jgi:Na+-transporting NADH:ubiquinone oxidoreductase subunit F
MPQTHFGYISYLPGHSPLPEDEWTGHQGFIHEVLLENYLYQHANARTAEYYLCGPPIMIKACTKMLGQLGVPSSQIAYDEF